MEFEPETVGGYGYAIYKRYDTCMIGEILKEHLPIKWNKKGECPGGYGHAFDLIPEKPKKRRIWIRKRDIEILKNGSDIKVWNKRYNDELIEFHQV